MRILQFTAGAAGMYRGSVLRDNALAAAMAAEGRDVTLVPLFAPTLTDEPNQTNAPVFFGGVSLFLQQSWRLFRNTPAWLDRPWDSPYTLRAAGRIADTRLLGAMTVSLLQGEEGHHRKEYQKLLHWVSRQPEPDVILLPSCLWIGLAAPLKQLLHRPVCCLLQGEDYFLESLPGICRTEALSLIRAQTGSVDAFVATGDAYARHMAGYLRIRERSISVAHSGISFEGFGELAPMIPREHPAIGYFSRIAPEKGLHLLCDAYHKLRERGDLSAGRLAVAGYLPAEHKSYLAAIQRRMKEWGLSAEFLYHGPLDREQKIQFLRDLDVFSVPSVHADAKGLCVLEAMAAGVPCVAPSQGIYLELLRRTSGGLLVEPGDSESLARGVLSILRDVSFADELRRNAYKNVRKYYDAATMADRTGIVLQRVQSVGAAV